MTLFGDFYFFAWVAALMIPAAVLGIFEKNLKYYGFAVSIFFIWMVMGGKPVAIINLVLYCIYEYVLVQVFLRLYRKYGRNAKVYWLVLILSLMPLIVWKVSAFGGHSIFAFMGLSYMTFKSAQVIIEIYDGLIKEVKGFEFIYFLIFFPALSSGPIDRSRRFHEDFTRVIPKDEYLDMVGSGLYKVCLGMLYKFVLASAWYQGIVWLGTGDHWWNNVLYMYSYGFYLFFDFAGYSLMAIGVSYMLGIKSPENFNKPFLSTDMKDFWDRWHMSLSYWFRDFIFSRFMMRAIKGKWFKNKLTGASIGFMINMSVMGIWHGLDIYYIMYGVYHGVLLALTEIYQKKSKFHKKNKKKAWYRRISWFITLNLAMFGFFIFSGRFTEVIGL